MSNYPTGNNADTDAARAAANRAAVRDAVLRGQAVAVRPSGVAELKEDAERQGHTAIEVPEGKLASGFYWYQRDPDLLDAEQEAMGRFFPTFQLGKLDDGSGRLYWRGKVQPFGKKGIVWDLMLIYKNGHPRNDPGLWGGSVQVLPVEPKLKTFAASLDRLPHVYREKYGRNEEYFICTADPKYVRASRTHSTTAASSLSWACKWILLFEMWLNGEVGDELLQDGVY